MPFAVRARPRIGGEIVMTVRRKDRGIDVGITVVPEACAITPHGVVVDIRDGERPEQRPDPSISAVAVPPPPARTALAMPARQRRGGNNLPSHRRVADPGVDRVAEVLRSEGSGSDLAAARKTAAVMQPGYRQYAADRESRDPKGAHAKTR